jgi:hypothetical protein
MLEPMTAETFQERFGEAPIEDDLDRVNCPEAGQPAHQQCVVCEFHQKPRFACGCLAKPERVVS